jgi:Putative redox-active protein (C_GCAxxG_C_C)
LTLHESSPADSERPLTESERALIERARQKAFILYEGKQVSHRSCGIALAETFGLPSRPYQALRRGGITGEGQCGAIKAGELILGELLGDPDPAGKVTDVLRAAMKWYQAAWQARVDRGGAPDIICNSLTRRFDDFMGQARQSFCTNIAAEVAALTAEALLRHGVQPEVPPLGEK